MADPSLEEESLISQDDIDKLLDASSIEEAEEQIETADTVDDDLGELSQDDIDSLLNGSALDDEDTEDEGGELSQDDIDNLMGNGPSEQEPQGELSQDDIDSLMNGPADENDRDEGSDDEDIELISQDDIDRLMNPADDVSDASQEADDELISMDDIQGLINSEEDDDGEADPDFVPDAPGGPDGALQPEDLSGDETPPYFVESVSDGGDDDPFDQEIDETEAADVAQSLLTQDTMDELLRTSMESEDVMQEDEDDSDTQDQVVLSEEDAAESRPVDGDVDGTDLPGDALSDEFDPLTEADGSDAFEPDLDDGDVTQEDIDALLQDSDDEDDFMDADDDILISQDDIDTLLMAADQEDEDVLGDNLMDDDGELDDFDDDDFLSSDVFDEPDAEADQVVLEGAEDSSENADETGLSPKRQKLGKLFKSKLMLAAVSAMLVLGISVPAVYFLFFSQTPPPMPEREVVPLAGMDADLSDITIEEEIETVPVRQSGTIILSDFIILTSDRSKNMTYVHADISIDYSDQRAYHEINNNSSFYRDLIYEAIHTSLVSEKENEVTEADLIWGVETSLKKVLPPHYIQKISFKTFRTS